MSVEPLLTSLLQEYLDTLMALHELANKKQEALLTNSVDRLEAIVAEEEMLLSQIERLDEGRRRAVVHYDDETRSPRERDAIDQLTAGISSALTDLRGISQENVTLSHQALRYVQWSLNLLGGHAGQSTYGSDGAIESDTPGRRVVDQKA